VTLHTAALRKPVIDKLEKWWKDARDKDDRVFPAEPELSLRISIMLDDNQLKAARLKAIEIIRKIELLKAQVRARSGVNYLINAMHKADKDIRRDAAAAASELSGIKIQYEEKDTDAVWLGKVAEFRQKWEALRGR
jgi:hypothetical protein